MMIYFGFFSIGFVAVNANFLPDFVRIFLSSFQLILKKKTKNEISFPEKWQQQQKKAYQTRQLLWTADRGNRSAMPADSLSSDQLSTSRICRCLDSWFFDYFEDLLSIEIFFCVSKDWNAFSFSSLFDERLNKKRTFWVHHLIYKWNRRKK